MKNKLLLLSYAVLFAGVSIYFGTGWSTVIFQFPTLQQLNVSNYYLHFVPQVAATTTFFTILGSAAVPHLPRHDKGGRAHEISQGCQSLSTRNCRGEQCYLLSDFSD